MRRLLTFTFVLIAIAAHAQYTVPFATGAKSASGGGGGNNIVGTNFTFCDSTPSGYGPTETCTTTFSPTNGRTLMIAVASDASGVTPGAMSCSDSEGTGNSYVKDVEGTLVNSTNIAIFRASNISGSGTYTIACTNASGNSYKALMVREYAGLAAASPVDVSAVVTGVTAANPNPGNITTTNANDVVISVFGSNSGSNATLTIGNSYTNVMSNGNGAADLVCGYGEKLVTATGTQTDGWTYSISSTYSAIHIAYKSN